MPLTVDASNSCIPPASDLTALTPPLPSTVRGEPVVLDGRAGRLNSDRPVLLYASGRLVIVRELQSDLDAESKATTTKVKAFVYRGHTAQVTCAKFSPSGCYIASGDTRGRLRIWSYDNSEHLCRLDVTTLAGPIRDVSWDADSKRIVVIGQGSKTDPSGVCTKVLQWDTGVKMGDLAQHTGNRGSTCSFRPCRPMRIATGGEDATCLFNKGPPFGRVVDGGVAERCHTRGMVHCVRFNSMGSMVASVGTDKSVCFYDGATMQLLKRVEDVHSASIYSCAWNAAGDALLTCSADGMVKLIHVDEFTVTKTWDVATAMAQEDDRTSDGNTPMGAMQLGCAFVQGDIPVTVSYNGKISILPSTDAASDNKKIQFLCGHQSPISSFAINYSTGIMYTGDSDGVICMWDLTTGDDITNIQRSEEGEECFDGTFMNRVHKGAITGMVCVEGHLLSIGWDDKLRVTETKNAQNSIDLEAQPHKIGRGTSFVVIITVNGLLLLRDNTIISDLIEMSYEPISVCISKNDEIVYIGGNDFNVHMYTVDGSGLNEIKILNGSHTRPVHALALSNDETKLASADLRDIYIWNVAEDHAPIIGRSRWCFHQQQINALAWSNDDNVLASCSNDDSIYLWSYKKTTTRIHYAYSHRGGVCGIEFLKNTDEMILLSVGNDGCVNRWDVADDVKKRFG